MKIELPKQNNYEIAFNSAADLLRKADMVEVAERCGAQWEGDSLRLRYFNSDCRILFPEVSFDPPAISLAEKILVLHYLTSRESHPAKGEFVAYKNLPSASFYNPTYRKRGTNRVLSAFGSRPEVLWELAGMLGAGRAEYGDVSLRIPVFPKIDAIVLIYRGDEEFPPEAEFLFKDDIISYLSLEDVAVLAGTIASRLIRVQKQREQR